ncbi:MAG: hypothetical protein U5J96_12070 [Ignavibacteriaceae bacterium]|nr:hypothetical protein [Ignavibacteriaceae bacterium]
MLKIYPEKVADYLEKKSLKKWNLEWNEFSGIQAVIVIPAICEFENIQRVLLSLAQNDKSSFQKSIVIFVINNSISSQQEVRDDNKSSLKFLRALMRRNTSDQLSNQIIQSGIRIGLIDAASEGKEFDDDEGGVGLARKVGMDTALQVFDYSTPGKKIIISLDADCVVESNYLDEIIRSFNKQNFSAANVEFEHNTSEDGINRLGIISYEIFLRHYVAGLLFAESPYAFHTVGSTVVCDHDAYIKVGGMNTKKAAEDFYFLQKLAKHYTINRIGSTKVRPSARESWRVPFGTGRSMSDFSSNKKDISLYDADVYIILKDWLELLNSDLSLNSSLILKEAKIIHPELYNFLESRGFSKDWEKILENSKSVKQLDYQRKNWFDAFETLKLIHHLRDTSFPMIDINSGIEKLFKVVQHSAKFELSGEKNTIENLYADYLSELKLLETTLHKKYNK